MNKYILKITIVLFVLFYQDTLSKDVECIANYFHKIHSFKNIDTYMDVSCAHCYWYLANILDENHWKNSTIINSYLNYTHLSNDNVYVCFNIANKWDCHLFKYSEINFGEKDNNTFLSQFVRDHDVDTFQKCCSDAKYCCESVQSSEIFVGSTKCPAKWDGWSCWHSSEPGTTQLNICPDMYYSSYEEMPSECSRDFASKECTTNGTWYKHFVNSSGERLELEFVNYENCLYPGANLKWRQSVLYVIGYSFSLLLTFIGSMIFLVYKQQKLLRVKIHLNFFLSLMLTCIFSILHYSQLNNEESNQITCKTFLVLHKCAHLANFCWMLIEGFHLHQMIATIGAVRDRINPIYYYVFGWGTAPLIMIVFICVHSMKKYDDICWSSGPQPVTDIIWETIPLFCIAANVLLLANVIRVLFTKLKSTPDHLRSGLKASIGLIPIYGIQFLFYVIPINPSQTCSGGEFFLQYTGVFVASLQGAMVTSIFCFFNREVRMNIRRSFRRRFPKKDSSEMVTEEDTV